ncbi:sodium-dependent dicarboxylate transporter 2/3/5 [Mobiluncus mulieris]|uniref:Na(+)/dicarboxylate symporter n=1 Tax=Mobiluncus mulieris TaxID=2052 RepID=A0A848RQ01_9ACTO|nr:SLC13 family permease [Mobiluncus mulieris]EFN92769.1 transporter, DASS family [Mobiluncus mulieris FB024-16]MBB5846822.1 sodium-dependent dicarboxylate transporter 2/3/5 [Mobiluncus mulieris]MCU9974016.1 SLC13/DASS family transporter [Mobiluncus mulieris]MCU9975499.1 SLC13/DASS family transporter [Mobiluncus mulieris]MCV0002786.1 SLC13/DASS family transporter [Mobiluncus mulieris]
MNAKKESSEPLLTHVRQLHTPTPAPPKVVRRRRPLSLKAKIGLVLGAIVFVLPLAIDIPHLDEPGERMLAIFLLAIVFWITEPIALSATAVLVIGLEVIMVSDRALVDPTLGDAALADQVASYKSYFATLANPVIILFMGGFMIADGAAKYGLDKNLAAVMLKPFPKNARLTTLGLMLITAVLSMFMSNTATTATMFTVVIPILATLPKGKARAGVALSIPLAANVGGIGTPVGTPPNAIAIGALAEKGITISFIQWMILAIPFMLVILFASWVFLSLMFIPKNAEINIEMSTSWNRSFAAVLFYIVAGTTILLWMTEFIHGVSSTVVGFLPVVVLLSLRVMTGEDIKKLDWPVLWLVAGGIALGEGVGATGLGTWMVGSIPWDSFSPMLIVAVTSLIGFAIANVISHSASANLLIPLAVTLAVSLESVDTMTVAVTVAIACSLGMSLPISTPPNAIAYSTGEVKVKEMATLGIVVGSVSTIVLVLVMPPLWQLLGLV